NGVGNVAGSVSNQSTLARIIASPATNEATIEANGGLGTNGPTFNGARINNSSALTAVSTTTTNIIFSYTGIDGAGHTNTVFLWPNRLGDGNFWIDGPILHDSNQTFTPFTFLGHGPEVTW